MKARVSLRLLSRVEELVKGISVAGVGVISPAQATLASWPTVLELDDWGALAVEQQHALINPDSDPASWALVVERDVNCFFDGVAPHLWPQVQIPARGPGSRVGLQILRPTRFKK